MYNLPKTLIKYFKAEDMKYFRHGSFRFGTLEQYRNLEGHLDLDCARFSDAREGTSSVTLNSDRPIDADLPGGTLKGVVFKNYRLGVTDTFTINDLTFCATSGPYDREQHLEMLNGRRTQKDTPGYSGNKQLTHYAVLDRIKFSRALILTLPKSSIWQPKPDGGLALIEGRVSYGKREEILNLDGKRFDGRSAQAIELRTRKAYFMKPFQFELEREYRFIARPYAPHYLPPDHGPLDVKSLSLKRSIIRFGRI